MSTQRSMYINEKGDETEDARKHEQQVEYREEVPEEFLDWRLLVGWLEFVFAVLSETRSCSVMRESEGVIRILQIDARVFVGVTGSQLLQRNQMLIDTNAPSLCLAWPSGERCHRRQHTTLMQLFPLESLILSVA